jgi:hypothetical protein
MVVLLVVVVEGGFLILLEKGELPAQHQRFLKHVYKYKYVAEQRKKSIEKELAQLQP